METEVAKPEMGKPEVKRFHFKKMTSSEAALRRMEKAMNYLLQTNISALQ